MGQIDAAFVKQFEAEVHEAYQRQGSKLRPTVRSKTGVRGASTVFPRVGKGTAAAKSRAGQVPLMNLDHATVECFLQDYYAGEWIDRLDEVIDHIRALPGCAELDVKYSTAAAMPFQRMKVRLKKEIVTLKVAGLDPARDAAP